MITLIACDKGMSTNELDLSEIDYNIINFDTFKKDYGKFSPFQPDAKSYKLQKADIRQCELLLREFALNYYAKSGKRIELQNYGRQYVGAVNSAGEKFAYLNCFCDPEKFPDREDEEVFVLDGGNCFFRMMINLTTLKIVDYKENISV